MPVRVLPRPAGRFVAALSRQFSDSDIGETEPGVPTWAVAVFTWVELFLPAMTPKPKSIRAGGVSTLT